MWKSINTMSNQDKGGLLALVLLGLIFAISTFTRWHRADQYQGQWGTFDSQDYFQQDSFPDGIRFEYPLWWDLHVYPYGRPLNLGAETRIQLTEPYSLLVPSGLKIYWNRAEENWNLDESLNWYLNDIARLDGPEERDQTRGHFQPTALGRQALPALFWDNSPSELAYIVVANDEALAFVCYRCAGSNDELRILQRIIDTVEIYQ